MTNPTRPTADTESMSNGADEVLGGFAAALRAGGVPVTADRTQVFLRSCAAVGAASRTGVYWAGRATLCTGPDDLSRYDAVFAAWFGAQAPGPVAVPPAGGRVPEADLAAANGRDAGDTGAVVRAVASSDEVLRHRDLATLGPSERAAVARLFAGLRARPPLRRSARRVSARRGEVDGRRTLRDQLRRGGEPARLRRRTRSRRPRRVVVLVDVSGSMAPYADSLLRWAHVVTNGNRSGTEVFTIGTRLTRVTPALRLRDSEAALHAAGETVPDWSGGTRLGETIRAFLDRWGQRGLARGAVIVILSDGWERGDSAHLAAQMRRLRRLAHRVVWVNPHQGKAGYLPVQSGIVAALPAVDEFLAGHSLATFERALRVVADA
jgi:uncharacterized protein